MNFDLIDPHVTRCVGLLMSVYAGRKLLDARQNLTCHFRFIRTAVRDFVVRLAISLLLLDQSATIFDVFGPQSPICYLNSCRVATRVTN